MALEYIEKRDGSVVPFDKNKIVNAIMPAMKESKLIDYEYAISIAIDIANLTKESKELKDLKNSKNINKESSLNILNVETIQDLVENKLMKKYPETARRYILYRQERSRIRDQKSDIMKHIKEKIHASNVINSNANIDEYAFSSRKNESAGVIMKEIALSELIDPDVKEKFEDNLLYIHDLTEYTIGTHNCLNIDLAKLLKNGFVTRNSDVRGAKSIFTAMQLACICFQSQSSQMFGGVGSNHIDRDFAPYVRISFLKHYADGLKYIHKNKKKSYENLLEKYGENRLNKESICSYANIFKDYSKSAYEYAIDMLEKEGKQSAQSFYHNTNTLESRAGGQLPFVSINFGLDTSYEGRCVTRWLLEASLDGVGKFHMTSIFPISIFQYKKDINDRKGTPNYDLFKLSLKSTSKRIYPNYVNCDWVTNQPDIHPTYLITNPNLLKEDVIKYIDNGKVNIITHKNNKIDTNEMISMKDLFDKYDKLYGKTFDNEKKYFYIDLRFVEDPVYVKNTTPDLYEDEKDNNERKYNKDYYVELDEEISKINYIIMSEDKSKVILTTDDFRFDIYDVDENNKIKETYHFCDNINFDHKYDENTEMSTMGCCDGNETITYELNGEMYVNDKFEDAWKRISEEYGPVKVWNKSKYVDMEKYKLFIYDSYINGFTKVKKFICNDDIGNWNKVTFNDGKEILLTSDHPLPTTRGRIFVKDLELEDQVYESNNPFTEKENTNNIKKTLSVIGIKRLGFRNRYGYDVETESDRFDVSGINSHNCRTLVGFDINGLGYSKVGRGNVMPATMNIAKLGIKHGICLGEREKPDIDGFWKEFDELLNLTKKSLLDRFKYIASQSPKSAYFMYDNETIVDAKASKQVNNVYPSMRHNSLSIGFLGVSNALYALFGKYQDQDPEVKKFGNEIVKRIYEYCKESSKKHNLNFACYATPAESLCYTAMKKLQQEYGIIKGVTDRDYLNNSYHVPVYEKISIKKKIDIESEYTYYCTGGAITYVEFDAVAINNLDSLEKIIKYAMEGNENRIPYFAMNFPIDNCLECGYSGVIDDSCPKCNAPTDRIQRLRRCTGYLTADYKTRFNPGKRSEVDERVKHTTYTNINNEIK